MPEEEKKEENVPGAGGEEAEEGEEGEKILDDKDYTPEVRKSVGEYVAERRARRAEKKQQEGGEEEEEENEEEERPDVASVVQTELQKALKPLTDFTRSQATDSEISVFLAANPQFKRFEKLARKDALAYPNVPIAKIFRSLAYDEQGEKKTIEAKKGEARQRQLGGASRRRDVSAPVKPSLITEEQMRDIRLRTKTGEKINPLEL